jgi:Zn-dependent peptidase ImmA (M78 family)
MPNINPEILTWARESNGFSLEVAAKKLALRDTGKATAAEKLLAFENGTAVSRPMLLKMVKQYRKPLVTFYLPNPPERLERGEDFRTLPNGISPEDDALVDVLIRDIQARQSMLRETLIEEDEAEELSFIGSVGLDVGFSDVATNMAETLNFSLSEFRRLGNTSLAFKYLRKLTEDLGVYVLLKGNLGSHHTTIDTAIFRGFVLSDEYAPFIVINDQDSKAAWCFTLLHELAHLWLGKTGVSSAFSDSGVEKFCNDVASDILLPNSDLNELTPDLGDFQTLADEIYNFASSNNISSGLVAYRLLRSAYINQAMWLRLVSYYKERWVQLKGRQKEANRDQGGGPSFYVVRRNKLGDALVSFVERMTNSGALTPTRASVLLGVKPIRVQKLFESGQAA